MTNEQLAIVLSGIHARLADALDEAFQSLPVEAKETGRNLLGQEFEYAPALGKLNELSASLRNDIEDLKSKNA